MTIRTRIPGGALLAFASFFGLLGPHVAAEETPFRKALAGTQILVVSPEAARGHGAWIETLLRDAGAKVERTGWEDASVEHAGSFDLVVVTGPRRRTTGEEVHGYDRPVLGVGPYGHVVFGQSRLKHGSPFS